MVKIGRSKERRLLLIGELMQMQLEVPRGDVFNLNDRL